MCRVSRVVCVCVCALCVRMGAHAAANHRCMLDSSVTVPLLKVLVTSRNMSLMSYTLFYFRNLTKTGTYHRQPQVVWCGVVAIS